MNVPQWAVRMWEDGWDSVWAIAGAHEHSHGWLVEDNGDVERENDPLVSVSAVSPRCCGGRERAAQGEKKGR